MARANHKLDCWPTEEQRLLLKAALSEGKEALEAWQRWKSSVDIAAIDYGSYRMLPLLYRNLTDHGINDPSLQRLKGVYRRGWYKNQLVFHSLSSLLCSFQEAGIETLILKGTALVLLHYKESGLRPMEDCDILVHAGDLQRAVPMLERLGWKSIWNIPVEALTAFRHSCNYEHPDGNKFDLHWHVMLEFQDPGADKEFWGAAVPIVVNGMNTRALNPTDQLLHACLHGVRWDPTPPLRWVADAMMIMKTAEIDWQRLIRLTRSHMLVIPMRNALHFVRDLLDAPVPPDVLLQLDQVRATMIESVDYGVRIRPMEQTGPLSAFLSNYMAYLRMRNRRGRVAELVGLPKFLQRHWHIQRFWQLPFFVAFKGMRRVWTVWSWRSKRQAPSLMRDA